MNNYIKFHRKKGENEEFTGFKHELVLFLVHTMIASRVIQVYGRSVLMGQGK